MLRYTTRMTHENESETLTPLQERFVREYPLDFNGTEAYMRASGYKNRKSAGVRASELLRLPKIKEQLARYIEDQLGPQEKQLLENVKFWREIRDETSPVGEVILLSEVLGVLETAASVDQEVIDEIKELSTIFLKRHKTTDRMKASEYLAKFAQMFVERTEVEHSGQVQIVDDVK